VPIPTECRFDEYTADTRLNRLLRAAAEGLLRLSGVTPSTRQALRRLASLLGESGPCQSSDLAVPTVFTRLNQHCRAAEHLARMVLGNQTLLGSAGSAGAGAFLIDMNKAFESFVAARAGTCGSGRTWSSSARPATSCTWPTPRTRSPRTATAGTGDRAGGTPPDIEQRLLELAEHIALRVGRI